MIKRLPGKILIAVCTLCLLCVIVVDFGTASEGMLWERIDEGLETGFYTKLLVNPDNNAILYLATKGGGVFKSINAGQEWVPVNNGIEGLYIDWIVMDPQNSEVLIVNSGLGKGTYKTINGGRSWQKLGAEGWERLPSIHLVAHMKQERQLPSPQAKHRMTGCLRGGKEMQVARTIQSPSPWIVTRLLPQFLRS